MGDKAHVLGQNGLPIDNSTDDDKLLLSESDIRFDYDDPAHYLRDIRKPEPDTGDRDYILFQLVQSVSPNDYLTYQMREKLKEEMQRQKELFQEEPRKRGDPSDELRGKGEFKPGTKAYKDWEIKVDGILNGRLKELLDLSLLMSEFKDLVFDFYQQNFLSYKSKNKKISRDEYMKDFNHKQLEDKDFSKTFISMMLYTLSFSTEEILQHFKKFCLMYFNIGAQQMLPKQFEDMHF